MTHTPAFPCRAIELTGDSYYEPGMSLRDWFAGQAMSGLLAANATYAGSTGNHPALAKDAYTTADAMLAERMGK